MVKLWFAIVFLAFLLVPSLTSATKVEPCDRRTKYAVQVTGVEITPNPVERGEEATFKISARTGHTITAAKMSIEVKLFGIHVHQEDHDLCDESSCPVAPGDFIISHSQVLPGVTPPGSYTLKLKMLEENGKELACAHFDFSVAWFANDSEPVVLADI
ncbi:hypothetical protein ACHQM5_019774 [Ranunculus cassubicifolius]